MNGLNFHDKMVAKMSETSDFTRTYTQSYNDWLDKHDAEIRADERRKFMEWAYDHSIIDVVKTKEARIAKYIEEYEKQMKEGT